MNTYCISYDLNKSGKNYDGLINEIKKFNYQKVLYSAWLIKSRESANHIYNQLVPFLDKDDHIFIFQIVLGNKQGWLPEDIWNWLN